MLYKNMEHQKESRGSSKQFFSEFEMIEINKIYNGDCVEVMKQMDNESVDLIVTSPPYDLLRDYKTFTFDYKLIAQQLYRIAKPGGVVVWVVGDQSIDGSETCTSDMQKLYFKEIGFNVHDTMIYEKTGFSNPSFNRYHQIFEFMFVFSKGKPKTFNPITDRRNLWNQRGCWGKNTQRQKDGSLLPKDSRKPPLEFGMRTNIWRYNTGGAGQSTKDKIAHLHPAIFPDKLAYDHIISWSNEGDLVLDPMCGSGTTCKMALVGGRNYIGIDISKEYCKLTQRRINNYTSQLKLF